MIAYWCYMLWVMSISIMSYMGWGDGESESFWILEQIIIVFLEIMIDNTLLFMVLFQKLLLVDIWKRP